jgi:hypothetical protein
MTSENADRTPVVPLTAGPPPSRPPVRPRVVYADLDGTLVGPGGSLFSARGATSLRAAEAVRALLDRGVHLVLVSGRGRPGLLEPARILGAEAFVAELGGLLVERVGADQVVVPNYGAFTGPGTPYEAMARTGAAAFLLERYPGALEPFRRFSLPTNRVASMLLRGYVDPEDATAELDRAGYGWLALHDNGRVRSGSPGLDVDEPHAMHLTPKGVDKASAIALHRSRNAIERHEAVAVGDSVSDLQMASEVAAAVIVANGVEGLGGAAVPGNAWRTTDPYGDGFAQAVTWALGTTDGPTG